MKTKWRVYGARIFFSQNFAGSVLLVARVIGLSSVKRASFSAKPNHSRPPFLDWSGASGFTLEKIVLETGNINLVNNFRKIICSEDDLRSRIFGSFSVKFLACLPLLGFSNIKKWYNCLFLTDFYPKKVT